MKQRTYPAYKESGIQWLGRIPEHWETRRLKYSVALVNQKAGQGDRDLPYTGLEHIESWTGKRIIGDDIDSNDGQANVYRDGDVIFGKLRPYLAKVHAAKVDGICSAEFLVLRPKLILQDFLQNFLLNPNVILTVDGSTYGAKMPRANWGFIGSMPMLVPSIDEQRENNGDVLKKLRNRCGSRGRKGTVGTSFNNEIRSLVARTF